MTSVCTSVGNINPHIIQTSEDQTVYEEGCLSIPETFADLPVAVLVGGVVVSTLFAVRKYLKIKGGNLYY